MKRKACKTQAQLVRRSLGVYKDTLHLDLSIKKHFSLIVDFSLYAKSFHCRKCDKLWKHKYRLKQHEAVCTGGIKRTFLSGVYSQKLTVFEELEEFNIIPDKPEKKFLQYFCFLDIECFQRKFDQPEFSSQTEYLAAHDLMSISIASNVPGFEDPKCFVRESSAKHLVKTTLNYLSEIQEKACKVMKSATSSIYSSINDRLEAEKEHLIIETKDKKKKKHPLLIIKARLDKLCEKLVVLTFNGGIYDLLVLRCYL